ncbi:HAD family hydrolase [Shimazuella sp. AN120528]|uniref:HAD family hydrolase n=1 Tax=Shimazuella soli TaxID=1892854 RepID=UPI001F0EC569|nr:HAD family hydrolase [Shimazuella soli]MCH5584395.1 HAD family hydrolase [Shimazuella soli]
MENHYSLFVSDLDGTLLTSDNQISMRTRQSLDRYQKNGGMFTIATGRSLIESYSIINELKIGLPVILCNGAMIYYPHDEELQVLRYLSKHIVEMILSSIENVDPVVDLLLFSTTNIYSFRLNPQKEIELSKLGITAFPIDSINQMEEEIIKLQLIGSPANMQILHMISESYSLRAECEFIQSHENYYEVVPKGISKGNALLYLNQILQIPTWQTAAIGNHLNDISMLKVAGLSASVANAHPLVKLYTDIHVPSNDADGVSYFIENYLL